MAKKSTKRDDWGFPVTNSSSSLPTVQRGTPSRNEQLEQIKLLQMLTNNTVTSRAAFAKWMLDQLHDIDKECGYPDSISAQQYKTMFERDGFGQRVVKSYPTASWAAEPQIYESKDETNDTEWETTLDNIKKKFSLVEKWKRLDILCGIGHYGVMLVGIDDGLPLDQPIEGVEEKLKLYFERDQAKKAALAQKQLPGQKQVPDQLKPGDKNSTDPNAPDPNELDSETPEGQETPEPLKGGSAPFDQQQEKDPFSAKNGKKKKPPIGNVASNVTELKGPLENEMPPSDGIKLNPNAIQDDEGKPKGKTRRLLYLVPFDETQASIAAIENNPASWRYGKPTYYNLTFFSPEDYTGVFAAPAQAQTRVHWTRIVHVPDNCQSNEVFGTPRMKAVFNYLLNIRKILGGDAESMYKTGFPGYSFEVPPEINDQVELDTEALAKEVDLFMNTLKKYMALQGVQAKVLQGNLADPMPHIEVQILAICVCLEIPKRIFMGSEEAKLAASEDVDSWINRVKGRNENQLTPRMIRPTLDLFMAIGLLPDVQEYFVDWPDLHTMSDKEKAEVALALTNALVAYIAGGGDSMVPPLEFLVNVFQWDRELAIAVLRAAEQRLNETAEADAADQEQAMMLDQQEREQQLEMQKTLADGLAEGAKAGGVHIPQQALPIPGGGGFPGKPPSAKLPNVGLRTPMSGGAGQKFGQKRLKGVADPFASSNTNNAESSIDKLTTNIERLINAWCPTGPGGGKDNSCSPTGYNASKFGSPAFQKWFKGSKVVDAAGNPLVVFHGTMKNFDAFQTDLPADKDWGMLDRALGAHFAEDPTVATMFTEGQYVWPTTDSVSDRPGESFYRDVNGELKYDGIPVVITRGADGQETVTPYDPKVHGGTWGIADRLGNGAYLRVLPPGGHVYPVHLSIRNPLEIHPVGRESDQSAVSRVVGALAFEQDKHLFVSAMTATGRSEETASKMWDSLSQGKPYDGGQYEKYSSFEDVSRNFPGMLNGARNASRAKAILQSLGYDGILYTNTSDNEVKGEASRRTWIAFEPGQIKSAIGNKGTYDAADKHIQNIFCATGEGGGVDPTCTKDGPDTGGGSGGGSGREYQQSLDGEFWLMDGTSMFADGDIGDMNHEGYAIGHAQREIMDLMSAPSEYEGDDHADWEGFEQWLEEEYGDEDGYLKAMEEAGVSDELYQVALGIGNVDPRTYAAEHWGWIRMHGNNVQMHDVKQLKELGDGIADAHQDVNLDNESFTIETKTGYYTDVPWSVIDAGDVGALREYKNHGAPGWGGTANMMRAANRKHLRNIFCATGKEGGKDPTCTKDDNGGGGTAVAEKPQLSKREAKNRLFEAQESSKQRDAKISQIISQLKKLRKLDAKHPEIPPLNARMEKLIEDRVKADAEVSRLKKTYELNAFCPTGKGGGKDNSCSPNGGSNVPVKVAALADEQLRYVSRVLEKRGMSADPKDWELKMVKLDDAKPTQSGEDYINDSSKYVAEHLDEFGSTGRNEDYAPIVLGKNGEIIDGNHRHAAHTMANKTHIAALQYKPRVTNSVPVSNKEKQDEMVEF